MIDAHLACSPGSGVEAVEPRERDALGAAEHLGEKAVGRPETTATRANERARSARREATPGSGRRPVGSSTMAASVPSKSRNSPACAGPAARGAQDGQVRPGVARAGLGQEEATVVVVSDARSWPMTTTTSAPVTPLTDTAAVSGRTCTASRRWRWRGRRLLLEARCVVDGRRRLARRRVDGCSHFPAAAPDDGRVVGRQSVGLRSVGHDDADGAGRDGGGGRRARRTPVMFDAAVVVDDDAAPAPAVVVLCPAP